MYKDFFQLKQYPFSLTPDPRFIVFTPSYNELLASLYYGIEMAKGLIVLTGEVGTGKTTALRWMIRRLDSSVLASYIFNPHLSVEEFYYHLTEMLEIKEWVNKTALLMQIGKILEDRHRRGLRTILIVDEAHELPDDVLEEIRLLMNFELDSAKLIQVILTGQPELREKFKQTNLRQLKQRVALRCRMTELASVAEVERYITQRLAIAGAENPHIFTPEAVDYIYQCTQGIPRQVNNLCDNAMIAAYSEDVHEIGRSIIEAVAENLDLLPSRENFLSGEEEGDGVQSARIMTSKGLDEILQDQSFFETEQNIADLKTSATSVAEQKQ
ncbi:MAG TPA: AAA family ATPase [Pyrinomonadaceae bacterium]|jgi:general secretion pathway protein A